MTDTRWQCRDCGALVYPYCERCPHCGAAREENDAEASNEHTALAEGQVAGQREEAADRADGRTRAGQQVVPVNGGLERADAHDLESRTAVLGAFGSVSKHGALPPVDWKARFAAVKAERGRK